MVGAETRLSNWLSLVPRCRCESPERPAVRILSLPLQSNYVGVSSDLLQQGQACGRCIKIQARGAHEDTDSQALYCSTADRLVLFHSCTGDAAQMTRCSPYG